MKYKLKDSYEVEAIKAPSLVAGLRYIGSPVQKGDYIVSFPDGKIKVMSENEFDSLYTPVTEKEFTPVRSFASKIVYIVEFRSVNNKNGEWGRSSFANDEYDSVEKASVDMNKAFERNKGIYEYHIKAVTKYL